jgi:diguanylate cyclase (GGDEF)-like protein
MQKTFIKYTFLIISTAILLILLINFLFTLHALEVSQLKTFEAKSEQVVHTLKNNHIELSELNQSLDEDYLTRARAAAYVIDHHQEVSMNVSEMQYLANLLNVDELHVINAKGYIVSASVEKYIGIDMSKHKQTREFLSLLESDEENAYLIQEPQPNAADNKLMQYVGVARKATKGIVQVGFEPTRQLEVQSRNTYDYIFSKFPTDDGEEIFAVDCKTGVVLGHSDGMERTFTEKAYRLDVLLECEKGAYHTGKNGKKMYVTSTKYNDILICTALPRDILYKRLWKNLVNTLLYLLFIEAAVILLLNYLIKRNVVDGIHKIIENLTCITNGNLDTMISVKGNQEFQMLSDGINKMVKSIVNISDRISVIIEMSGIPLAAFEYDSGINHVFATSGLGKLLDLSSQKSEELYSNSDLFDRYIRDITRNAVEGEENIFQINNSKYIRLHMSKSPDGYLGVITDATKYIEEKQKLRYENIHDHLTGLYKFPHFKQVAAELLTKMPADKICAIVMFDLDSFKSINDTFGHDAGDRYLKGFSSVMNSMPATHFITARRSGDEFCMMIYDCKDKKEIECFLDSFYDVLSKTPVVLSDTDSKTISASGGYAWTADSGADVAELLSSADKALYKVKQNTKGCYVEYNA